MKSNVLPVEPSQPPTVQSRLIGRKEAAQILGIHFRTLDKWERSGLIPKRRALGPRHVGWPDHEIYALVEQGHGRGIGATSFLKPAPSAH